MILLLLGTRYRRLAEPGAVGVVSARRQWIDENDGLAVDDRRAVGVLDGRSETEPIVGEPFDHLTHAGNGFADPDRVVEFEGLREIDGQSRELGERRADQTREECAVDNPSIKTGFFSESGSEIEWICIATDPPEGPDIIVRDRFGEPHRITDAEASTRVDGR